MKAKDIVKIIGYGLMILSIFLPGSELYNVTCFQIGMSSLIILYFINLILSLGGLALCVVLLLSNFVPAIKEKQFIINNEKKLTFFALFIMLAFSFSTMDSSIITSMLPLDIPRGDFYSDSVKIAGYFGLIGFLLTFFAIGPKTVLSAFNKEEK